jgi:hypothetical protein
MASLSARRRDWLQSMRQTALVALIHVALIASIWLFAILVYAFVFESVRDLLWTVIDVVAIADSSSAAVVVARTAGGANWQVTPPDRAWRNIGSAFGPDRRCA